MAYRGFSGGGFVGNHLTTALLEALRPAADNAGRHATVGSPDTTAAPYVSDGESWKSVPLVSADGTSLVSGDGTQIAIGVRTTPLRVVTFGDSTAAVGASRIPTNQDVTQIAVDTWQSGTKSVGFSLDKFATHLFYPQAYLVGNGGIAGNTTTQMLARDTSAASVTRYAITDMINQAPNAVLLRGGSINDLTTVTSGTLAATVAATYANHVRIINRFLAANIPVVDCGIYGYSGSATDLSATRSALLQLNALFAAYAAANPTMVKFVSPLGIVSDSAGAYISTGISSDGTHLTTYGQHLMAQQEAAALTQLFGVSSGIRFPGANNFANAVLANTGSPGYGTVATGITISAANATRQNAQIEVIDGKVYQTCEFAITAGSNTGQFSFAFDPSGTGTMAISSGDVWGFEFDFYLAGVNGYALNPTNSLAACVDVRDSVGSGRVVFNYSTGGTALFPAGAVYKGHVALPPLLFGDVSANLTTVSSFYFLAGMNDSSGTFKMGVSMPRIVKLNQAVLTG